MAEPVSRDSKSLTSVLELLSMGCLAFMTILVVAQVALRYVFNAPLTWSEELARIIFIYLTFAGIGAAYGRRRHMFVDSFLLLLPPKIKRTVETLVVGLATVFFLTLIGVVIRSMGDLLRSEIMTPALEIPMAWVYLIIPLGMSAFVTQMWIVFFRERKR